MDLKRRTSEPIERRAFVELCIFVGCYFLAFFEQRLTTCESEKWIFIEMVLELIKEDVPGIPARDCGMNHLTQLAIIDFSAPENNRWRCQNVYSAASVLRFTFVSLRASTGFKNCPV